MLRTVSAFLAIMLHRADAFLLTWGRYAFPELVGLPIIHLTMRGAKTGKLRLLPLVGIPDGADFALIATNFGQKHNPGWYYNLKAHPECHVQKNGKLEAYIAREANGQEYEKYWQLALSYYAGYDKYRERAGRRIPIMVLEPKV